MSQLQLLYQLQRIDTEFQEKKERLSEVLRAQKETEAVRRARRRVEEIAQALQKLRTHHTDRNLELESVDEKATRSEKRLYSGKVTNPKELADLQQEIDSLARRREALEDQILDVMIEIEEMEAAKAEADAALEGAIKKWERARAELKQEEQKLARRLHRLNEERKKVAPQIENGRLAEYNSLKQKLNGVAVAALKRSRCQGCNMMVSNYTAKVVREGTFTYCENCGRILYHG